MTFQLNELVVVSREGITMLLASAVNRYYDTVLIKNMLFISPFLMPIMDTTSFIFWLFFVT